MDERRPSGLGRSIDELFRDLSAGEGGGAGSSSSPEPADEPSTAPAPEGAAVESIREDAAAERARDFAALVAAYLEGSPEDRDRTVPRIVEAAEELRRGEEPGPLAEAIIDLTLAGVDGADREALALARELLDPSVAPRIAERVGGARDEEEEARLGRVIAAHAEAIVPAITEALAEAGDRGVRRSLMDALRGIGEAGRDAAMRLLEDDRWFAVRNGVVLLGELGGDDAVQALTVPLGHEDPRVRREAVTALGKLGGEDAGLLLVGMLEDGAVEVRAAAATGVGLLRVERAQRVLEEMLDREDSEDILVPVIRALGQLGDPGPVPALEKRAAGSLFSRPPRDVRIAAYRALAAIGTPHARSVLRNGAGDKDPEIRYAVGMILRQLAQERERGKGGTEGSAVELEDGGEQSQEVDALPQADES